LPDQRLKAPGDPLGGIEGCCPASGANVPHGLRAQPDVGYRDADGLVEEQRVQGAAKHGGDALRAPGLRYACP